MADEDQDDSQKTEEPTQKRIDDAVRKGSVPSSREVTSFLLILVLAFTIIWLMPFLMKHTMIKIRHYITDPHLIYIDSQSMMPLAWNIVLDMLSVMIIPAFLVMVVIIFSSVLQHGLVFSSDSIMPNLERISIFKGIKRLFSTRSIVELIKGIIKIIIVGVIAFIAVYPEINQTQKLISSSVITALILLANMAKRMLIGICGALFILAVLDFLYQRFEYIKSMRMSKRDIKDEFKQTEGSPEVKAKLREIRAQRSGKRMMSDVPKSDVIITNPTHYSIALQYESEKTEAPVVVAKGKDLVALKIKEIARENQIPIVENPPLARALFEIGQALPFEHYKAVAEVIRYVYKLKGKTPKKMVG